VKFSNTEILKITNNKQKCTQPEIPEDPAKRKEKTKIQDQTAQATANLEQNQKQSTREEACVIWR